MGLLLFADLFRGAGRNNLAASFAAFRAEVDDPIRFGDQVEVVFDDDDTVTCVYELLQNFYEAFHIGHVKTDGWLFENEEIAFHPLIEEFRLLFESAEQVGNELHALGFTTAESRADLAEL